MPCKGRRSSLLAFGALLLDAGGALGVVALLAFLVASTRPEHVAEERTRRTLEWMQEVRSAAIRHVEDCGRFAHEYPAADEVRHHELTQPQADPRWRGPYLPPIRLSRVHPAGGSLQIYNLSLVHGLTGWDLDGDGAPERDRQGPASVLWMNRVPEDWAKGLDAGLEADGLPGPWSTTGRLQWSPQDGGTLWWLLAEEQDHV